MAKKNKNNINNSDQILAQDFQNEPEKQDPLVFGRLTPKDLIAVDIERSGVDYMRIGDNYVRSLFVSGVPSVVSIGWLDELYNYDGDNDTIIHVHPADTRSALDQLTQKITQFQAQLDIETKRGNIRNITMYQDKIDFLINQRRALEQNRENLYYVQIGTNLYENSIEALNRQTLKLENNLKGRRINIDRMYLTSEDAYKSAYPIGMSFIKDKFRNFNTGALAACFPFYDGEVCQEDGVFFGINLSTKTPLFINAYNRKIFNNSNMSVFGTAGSGKTFFVSLLTMRSAIQGIRTALIDPEGEYDKVVNAIGGVSVKLYAGSPSGINPCDVEAEDITDDFGQPTGKQTVDIKGRIADLMDLISVMVGTIPPDCQNFVASAIQKMYDEKGITSDPSSLFDDNSVYDEEKGQFVRNQKKHMPTLSDFKRILDSMIDKSLPNYKDLASISNAMASYCQGGIYDLFDRETSEDLRGYQNSIAVNFNVSELEQGHLRPLAMFVAMTWIWETFVKRNPKIKKRVVCDEAWMLVSQNIDGHEYTSTFLEKCARRIRKRNGGLLVASQNFTEFTDSPQGRAVLNNTTIKMLLRQDATSIDILQETFQLSDGERNFLLSAKKGNMVIKFNKEDIIATSMPSDFEKNLISIERVVGNNQQKQ